MWKNGEEKRYFGSFLVGIACLSCSFVRFDDVFTRFNRPVVFYDDAASLLRGARGGEKPPPEKRLVSRRKPQRLPLARNGCFTWNITRTHKTRQNVLPRAKIFIHFLRRPPRRVTPNAPIASLQKDSPPGPSCPLSIMCLQRSTPTARARSTACSTCCAFPPSPPIPPTRPIAPAPPTGWWRNCRASVSRLRRGRPRAIRWSSPRPRPRAPTRRVC